MKAIQITIDDRLLAALDRALTGGRRQRSAFIRQSIANELRRMRLRKREEADRRGYLENPVTADEFEIAPEQLVWGDDWNEEKRPRKRA